MREIPLSNGGVTLVDDDDYERLAQWTWQRSTKGYAARCVYVRGGRSRSILMHREILNVSAEGRSRQVDHINLDKLDNRRANLRHCTHQQNLRNSRKVPFGATSRFKGVSLSPSGKMWCATISIDNRTTYLGGFRDESDAARAYDNAAREQGGVFARLNFPRAGEQSAAN